MGDYNVRSNSHANRIPAEEKEREVEKCFKKRVNSPKFGKRKKNILQFQEAAQTPNKINRKKFR